MKKLSQFKKMKNEAATFLSEELELHNFNRFTEEEIKSVYGYYPNVDKAFIAELITNRLLKCLPIKLNFENFILDIKILRKREYEFGSESSYVSNEVITKISFSSRKIETNNYHVFGPTEITSSEKKTKTRHRLIDLLDMRAALIVELSKITKIHNELCKIFKDIDGKHPSILSEPEYSLSGDEIKEICG